MATFNLATTSNPAPLGFVKPTAGTPLPVTNNFTNLGAVMFKGLLVLAHPSNVGYVYVLNNSSPADKTNGTNIVAILAAGQSLPFTGAGQGGINPAQYWIDVDTTGAIAVPSVFGD